MTRYRRRPSGHKDSNHDAVVRELRQLGASVLETHALGDGAPDLVVGFRGVTALVELKNGSRYHQTQAAKRSRLERQQQFLAGWQGGLAFVAETTEQVLERLVDASVPEPLRVIVRPLPPASSWSPLRVLLTPAPASTSLSSPAPEAPMPPPKSPSSPRVAGAPAAAPATPES